MTLKFLIDFIIICTKKALLHNFYVHKINNIKESRKRITEVIKSYF